MAVRHGFRPPSERPVEPPPEIIDLTEADMQRALAYEYGVRSLASSVNAMISGFGYWEWDFVRITPARYMYEYEIKRTLSDFRKDFTHKKVKHRFYSDPSRQNRLSIPNYFYFVVPEPLREKIKPLIPDYAGMITVNQAVKYKNRGKPICDLTIVIDAPRLHAGKATDETVQRTLRAAMTSLMRRI